MMRIKLNITNAHNINIIRSALREALLRRPPASRCGRLQCRPYGKRSKQSSSVPASSASPARALARRGIEALILERHEAFGTETSARNSEVVHAGIYYPTGSLKARLCVAGRDAIYAYCTERGIAHRRCGKLIVATDASQLDKLEALYRQGLANGVADLTMIGGDGAMAMEPNLYCIAAISSPSTGIFDSHAYMLALLGDAERNGAMLAVQSPVSGGRVANDGGRIEISAGDTRLSARIVINAAGLRATPGGARARQLRRCRALPDATLRQRATTTRSGLRHSLCPSLPDAGNRRHRPAFHDGSRRAGALPGRM